VGPAYACPVFPVAARGHLATAIAWAIPCALLFPSRGRATFPNTCSRYRISWGSPSKEQTDGSDQASAGDF
jgi:hypothetical protein